jgi:hypothetical protein
VHRDRRWRLNIKVKKKGPSQMEVVITSFIKLPKIMVLISFELWLPLSLASWVVKVNVRTNSYMLDKSHVPWIWVPKPHATRLRSQISSCHCKHTCIIKNANGVPPARWYGSFPISKWQDKQTMNTSTSHLFTIGYSFLFWDASSNVHYGYAINFYHEWCMV